MTTQEGTTMPRERPIIFTAESVNAILAGRKTMTRRVIKPQPRQLDSGKWYWQKRASDDMVYVDFDNGHAWWEYAIVCDDCPFRVGMTLWVRETFTGDWRGNGIPARGIINYRANGEIPEQYKEGNYWRSPLFMPRWASRITLEVTGVKAERLHRIGELSAKAEGVTPKTVVSVDRFESYDSYCAAFIELWDGINGKKYPWESNPWVWVIEFELSNK